MTSRNTRNQEQKRDELGAANEAIMAMLKTTLDEHKASLSAEFKTSVQRLENKLDSVQMTLNSHDQRITALEIMATTTNTELQDVVAKLAVVVEDNDKLRARLIDVESRSRRNNIRLLGIPENIEWPRPTVYFSQMLVDIFGVDVLKTAPELDRAHWALVARPGPNAKPRAVVVCFHSYQTRELVVRKAREVRDKLKYKDTPIHIVEDYCPEVLEQRSAYREVMKELYDLGLKPQLRYPARLFVVSDEGSRRRLASPGDARSYIASHRPLSSNIPGT
ncbi:unnamed protein product [Oreochromis niloticus]|nr:unnamed protein product [Mustela putorius furo]